MKRVAYSLLLMVLLSCGASHPLNYVRIEFRDSPSQTYLLDSLCDSMLIVHRSASPTDSMERIPFAHIERIFIQGNTTGGELAGCFGGCAVGLGVMYLVTTPAQRSDGLSGIIIEPFIPMGILVGNKLTDKLHEVDLYSPADQKLLKDRAKDEKGK